MKLKLYYGAIALLWLLTSCSPTNNITPRETIGIDDSHNRLYSFQINGHEYIHAYHGLTHSGECIKCKHELDSIVRRAVKEVLECQ